MAEQLKRLSVEDERPSLNRELVYLLGCKLEGIDNSRNRRAEREKHQQRLAELEAEAGKLWRTLLMTYRHRELDTLLPELRDLLKDIQATRQVIESIPDHSEAGEPGN